MPLPQRPSVRDVVALLDEWYPPATAEAWDAVGLVSGDPDAPVSRILLAVDPAPAVAAEAAEWGADLLVVHHPLFLKAVHGVAATTPKGRTLATLTRAGCALLTAHTNADQAVGGVSEALATALGLADQAPILPAPSAPLDKLVVFVPVPDAERVRTAMTDAGAGRIGDYDSASFTSAGEGRFRPLDGASPTIGEVGRVEVVDELRVECVVPRDQRARVVRAMLAAHPYEEPAWDLIELADAGLSDTGTGRVGTVTPTTLAAFAKHVAGALPATPAGIRYAGDPDRVVRRVAVCGGAGDFLLGAIAGQEAVDVYVTSDLRHHPAAEFLEQGGPALVDVPHWAAEWTWLPVLQARLARALGHDYAVEGRPADGSPADGSPADGSPGDRTPRDTVEARVSRIVTDPWHARV